MISALKPLGYVVEITLIELLSRNTLSRNSDVWLNLTCAGRHDHT